jgi:hypothetical protein
MVRKSFGHRASEIEADRVMVTFGPEVTASLLKLEDVARKDPKFDSDVLGLLQNLNSGQPVDVKSVITRLAMVVEEACDSANRTHDVAVRGALTGVIGSLLGPKLDSKTITVTVEPKVRSHSPAGE